MQSWRSTGHGETKLRTLRPILAATAPADMREIHPDNQQHCTWRPHQRTSTPVSLSPSTRRFKGFKEEQRHATMTVAKCNHVCSALLIQQEDFGFQSWPVDKIRVFDSMRTLFCYWITVRFKPKSKPKFGWTQFPVRSNLQANSIVNFRKPKYQKKKERKNRMPTPRLKHKEIISYKKKCHCILTRILQSRQNKSPFHILTERSSLPLAIKPDECASTEYTREVWPIISNRGWPVNAHNFIVLRPNKISYVIV